MNSNNCVTCSTSITSADPFGYTASTNRFAEWATGAADPIQQSSASADPARNAANSSTLVAQSTNAALGNARQTHAAHQEVDVEGFIDTTNFLETKWVVRLDRIEVQGNLAISGTGTPYCWIGLNLGRLLYYPTVNFQKFTPYEVDACYEAEEGMATVQDHHISIAYLPTINQADLDHLLRDLNDLLSEWRLLRWNPEQRLRDFIRPRHIYVLHDPLTPENITWQDFLGSWVKLRSYTAVELMQLYDDRRIANTWQRRLMPDRSRYDWYEVPESRQELLRVHANNVRHWAEAQEVVAATSRMAWAAREPEQSAEWTKYTTCWLRHPTSLLLIPSELHEICFWIVYHVRTHPATRQFHAIWNGKRNGSWKVQGLGELHCTPHLSPNGLVAVQFCCPRVEAALGR